MSATHSLSLWFTSPRRLELRQAAIPDLQPGQVLVKTECSAISPGTEMLFYRGQFAADITLDATIPALAGPSQYPLQYGYSLVGRVMQTGPGVDPAWLGRRVFAFQPHQQYFVDKTENLFCIPEDIPSADAVFMPNLETAASLVMDAAPLIGESAVVFGQGIVGLLTAALLARFPLQRMVTVDQYPIRQAASLALGAHASLDPALPGALERIRTALGGEADLAFEISGAPQALDQAIAVTGFGGRVMIGSWYGSKPISLNLGGKFHRSRIRLLASQVSSIDPSLSGRWTKERRFGLVWDLLRLIKPSCWITQSFDFTQAASAYALLDTAPSETIQVILKYS